jgi:hypothetical protein
MKLIVFTVLILCVASSSWFWHLKTVDDQKKKAEICLTQYTNDVKLIRVGLDSTLNQQELDKVNAKFQTCITK